MNAIFRRLRRADPIEIATGTSADPYEVSPSDLHLAARTSSVASIGDLRGLATPANGTPIVYVRGYLSDGDGGEGLFRWASASTTTDNGGTVIAPTAGGTGRWLRLDADRGWRAGWFGVAHDGVTDAAPALNTLITALSTGAGAWHRTLYLEAGPYRLNSPLVLQPNVRIVGVGHFFGQTSLRPYRCRALIADGVDGAGTDWTFRTHAQGLMIHPIAPSGSPTDSLIYLNRQYDTTWQDIYVYYDGAEVGWSSGAIAIAGGNDAVFSRILMDGNQAIVGGTTNTGIRCSGGTISTFYGLEINNFYRGVSFFGGRLDIFGYYGETTSTHFYHLPSSDISAGGGLNVYGGIVQLVNSGQHGLAFGPNSRVSIYGTVFNQGAGGNIVSILGSPSGTVDFLGHYDQALFSDNARKYIRVNGHHIWAGSPEGNVTATVGAMGIDYTNSDLYLKTGTGNTGWKLVTRAA